MYHVYWFMCCLGATIYGWLVANVNRLNAFFTLIHNWVLFHCFCHRIFLWRYIYSEGIPWCRNRDICFLIPLLSHKIDEWDAKTKHFSHFSSCFQHYAHEYTVIWDSRTSTHRPCNLRFNCFGLAVNMTFWSWTQYHYSEPTDKSHCYETDENNF